MCVLIFLLLETRSNNHSNKEHRIEQSTKEARTAHRSLPQREEAHHHAPILSHVDKSRSEPNPHQPQGMPQKYKPRNSKKNPRNRHSRPQQQRPRHYTHYCHRHGCTAPVPCQQQPRCPRYARTTISNIRPDPEDPYGTRITTGGDRLIDTIIDPRTVTEPRTAPQADHEDPVEL